MHFLTKELNTPNDICLTSNKVQDVVVLKALAKIIKGKQKSNTKLMKWSKQTRQQLLDMTLLSW